MAEHLWHFCPWVILYFGLVLEFCCCSSFVGCLCLLQYFQREYVDHSKERGIFKSIASSISHRLLGLLFIWQNCVKIIPRCQYWKKKTSFDGLARAFILLWKCVCFFVCFLFHLWMYWFMPKTTERVQDYFCFVLIFMKYEFNWKASYFEQ